MLKGLLQRMIGHWPTQQAAWWFSNTPTGLMPVISPLTALQYTPVFRAASLIANDCARARAEISDGAADVLFRNPNRYQSAYEFRRSMTLQALLYGNSFALINRTVGGELLELMPLEIDSVSLDVSQAVPFYKTRAYGDVPASSMLHIRGIGLDGLWGESPVRLCRTALTIMASQEQAQLESMKNAGNPKLAFVHPGPLSEAARQSITDKYLAHHSGSTNAGKPLVLAEGMRIEKVSSTLDDAGIAEARQYSIEDVSRLFGVPAHMLGETSNNAYGSLEWSGRAYLDGCISHWLAAWENELKLKLATPFDSVLFDVDFLIRPSLAEQMAALRTGVEAGIITRNEARARLDMPPIQGLDDVILALNMGTGGGQTNLGDDTSGGTINDFTS